MGSLTLSGTAQTIPSGQKTIGPLTISGSSQIGAVLDSVFAGAQSNTIVPPAGATGCVIVPPSGNLIGLTLKGVAGDTGIALQPNQPFAITFANPTSPASFVLTSAGAISGLVEITFF